MQLAIDPGKWYARDCADAEVARALGRRFAGGCGGVAKVTVITPLLCALNMGTTLLYSMESQAAAHAEETCMGPFRAEHCILLVLLEVIQDLCSCGCHKSTSNPAGSAAVCVPQSATPNSVALPTIACLVEALQQTS